MPLQFISMPLPSMQLRAFRCLCSSVHFSSMPSLCYSGLRQSTADQIDSALTHALANHRASFHRHAFAFLFRAPQSLCLASLCCALPLLFTSWHYASLPSHYISMLFAALAILYISSPCLRCSTQVTSLPRNTVASLRVLHSAVAFLCSTKHCAAIAMQR